MFWLRRCKRGRRIVARPIRRTALIRSVLACALILYVLVRVHPAELMRAVRGGQPFPLLSLVGLAAISFLLQMLKWRMVLRFAWPDASTMEALSSLAAGLSLGIATPARVGELGRAWFLPGRDVAVATGLVLLDRTYALGTVLALGYLGALSLNLEPAARGWWPVVGLALVGALLAPRALRKLGRWLARRFLQLRGLEEAAGLLGFWQALRLVGANLACTLFLAFEFTVAVRSFSAVHWIPGLWAGLATLAAKAAIPLSIGDIGVRETAAVLLYHKAGAAPAGALSGALCLYVLNVALPALLGLRWVSRRRAAVSPEKLPVAQGVE